MATSESDTRVLIHDFFSTSRGLVYSKPLKGAPEWGPLKRIYYTIDHELFDGITTVSQLMRKVFKEWEEVDGIGTRQLFGEEYQTQGDGKVFKKARR